MATDGEVWALAITSFLIIGCTVIVIFCAYEGYI